MICNILRWNFIGKRRNQEMTPEEASAARKRVHEIHDKIGSLLELFVARRPLLKGCLYESRRKCGKKGCACTTGRLHTSLVLAYRGRGGQQNLYPPGQEVSALKEMTSSYQRFRKSRAELAKRFRELMESIAVLELWALEAGESRFRETETGRKAR